MRTAACAPTVAQANPTYDGRRQPTTGSIDSRFRNPRLDPTELREHGSRGRERRRGWNGSWHGIGAERLAIGQDAHGRPRWVLLDVNKVGGPASLQGAPMPARD